MVHNHLLLDSNIYTQS